MLKLVPEFATWKPPPPAGGFGPRPSPIRRRSSVPGAFVAQCLSVRLSPSTR